jgi:outer membrane protein assembly factor BamB
VPTEQPSEGPTASPSTLPSITPTIVPSDIPTVTPTSTPSATPSVQTPSPIDKNSGLCEMCPWPEFRRGYRNNALISDVETCNNGSTYKLLWKYQTAGAVESSPAVGLNDVVYVGSSDGRVYAFNKGGKLRWMFNASGPVKSGPAVTGNSTIYFTDNSTFYAVSESKHGPAKIWSASLESRGSVLSASASINLDGSVFIGSTDGYIRSFSASGSMLWEFMTDGSILSTAAVDSARSRAIFFGSNDSNVYSVSADGILLWRHKTGAAVVASPAMDSDGSVYAASTDGYVYAFRPGKNPAEKASVHRVQYEKLLDSASTKASAPAVNPIHAYESIIDEAARAYAAEEAEPMLASCSSKIGMFTHGIQAGTSRQASNLITAVKAIVPAASLATITNLSAVLSMHALVVPELERGSLTASRTEVSKLTQWVTNGGIVVVVGDSRGEGSSFVNSVFSKAYAPDSPSLGRSSLCKNCSHAHSLPLHLPAVNQVWALKSSSVNSAEQLYSDKRSGSGAGAATTVAHFSLGKGHVTWLGYNWDTTANQSEWNRVLQAAVGSPCGQPSEMPSLGASAPASAAVLTGMLTSVPQSRQASATSSPTMLSKHVAWQYKTSGPVVSSPAIGYDGSVYVGSTDHHLYALSRSGQLRWRYKTGGMIIASAAVGCDDTIFVGSADGYLYALSSDGLLHYKYKTGGKIISSPAVGSDGVVYFGSDDGHVYALGRSPRTAAPSSSAPVPTDVPTNLPSASPSKAPTEVPTTLSPTTTDEPSFVPTRAPSDHPTAKPTTVPTDPPTHMPVTGVPTVVPTTAPPTVGTPTPCTGPVDPVQHAIHAQVVLLKGLVKKYKSVGTYDYVSEQVAARQLKELVIMEDEWYRRAEEYCRKPRTPAPVFSPVDRETMRKLIHDCCEAFRDCIGGNCTSSCVHNCVAVRSACESKAYGQSQTLAPLAPAQ